VKKPEEKRALDALEGDGIIYKNRSSRNRKGALDWIDLAQDRVR